MFEKQKANGVEFERKVEISEGLQSEFQQKYQSKNNENSKVLKLLAFANEQIRRQAQEIQKLKVALPQTEGEGEETRDVQDE